MTNAISFIDGSFSESLPNYVDDSKLNLSANALTVLDKRYLWRGENGEKETPAGMFYHVARWVGLVDLQYGVAEKQALSTVERFYSLLASAKFLPNSSTLTEAGTPLGQLAACSVLPLADDMGKEDDGIFSILRKAVLIEPTGGGNGFSFGRIRPKGAAVKTSNGHASGPVSFLGVFDEAFGPVAQGDTCRGATMSVLPCYHPDIEEFIECKAEEGEIKNFNISVAITDKFMLAVVADGPFDLLYPGTNKVVRTVRARDLFDKIVKCAHENGEPGMLFIDTANASNPVPHIAMDEATNSYGQQWLLPYEDCCFGSINLANHVIEDDGNFQEIDWAALAITVFDATHFLDNVVTVNSYVSAVPELKAAGQRARRIGLGIMGLSDLFYKMGIRYGSQPAQELAAQIMEFVRYHCMSESTDLARVRGPFPAYKGSMYDGDYWEIPKPLTHYTLDFGRPVLDWQEIKKQIRFHGIRNAAQTTMAPTGTLSPIAAVEGYGCEPVFALGDIRHFKDGDNDVELAYTSPLFAEAIAKAGMTEENRKSVLAYAAQHGTLDGCPYFVSDSMRKTFVVRSQITAEEQVWMQASMQPFVDSSISQTCNLPEGATADDVARAYMLAWELGCKGLTVYVTGSRSAVVLETK